MNNKNKTVSNLCMGAFEHLGLYSNSVTVASSPGVAIENSPFTW